MSTINETLALGLIVVLGLLLLGLGVSDELRTRPPQSPGTFNDTSLTFSQCISTHEIPRQYRRINNIRVTGPAPDGLAIAAELEFVWEPHGRELIHATGVYTRGLVFTDKLELEYRITGFAARRTVSIKRRGFIWTVDWHAEPTPSSVDWLRPEFNGITRTMVCF